MNGALEFFAQHAGVTGANARHEHALLAFQKFSCDFDNLSGRFARAENDLGKPFAQRAVRVHLRKAEVGHRRGLECPQNPVTTHAAGAEFFQQLNGFGCRQPPKGIHLDALVTRENSRFTNEWRTARQSLIVNRKFLVAVPEQPFPVFE